MRLRDLAAMAGAPRLGSVLVSSLERGGAFSHAVLGRQHLTAPESLLALEVNGVDLSPDHGHPARSSRRRSRECTTPSGCGRSTCGLGGAQVSVFRVRYGSSPLQLLAVAGCLALSGTAVVQLVHSSALLRIVLWFLGAVVAHDLVLCPLYTAADRALGRVLSGGSVNWVRVPALLSGLLLLLFWPSSPALHSEGSYRYASGLDQPAFLGRYLAVVAVLFLGSGLLLALTRLRR